MADMRGIRKGASASASPLLLALSLAACVGLEAGHCRRSRDHDSAAGRDQRDRSTAASQHPGFKRLAQPDVSPNSCDTDSDGCSRGVGATASSASTSLRLNQWRSTSGASTSCALTKPAPQPVGASTPQRRSLQDPRPAPLSSRRGFSSWPTWLLRANSPATLQAMSQLVSLPATGGGSLSGTADGKLIVEVRLSDTSAAAQSMFSARGFAVLAWAPQFATANLSVEPARLA